MAKRVFTAFDRDVFKGLVAPCFDVFGEDSAVFWGIGVSGGSDSVGLLTALVEAGFGDRVMVLHMNHGWGEADDAAEAFVEELCERLDVSLMVGQGAGIPDGGSMEAGAREERMAFFAQQVEAMGLSGVMLGHHADDMVEHVLMRLARGSGVQGLVGLKSDTTVEGVRYVRPLLSFRKTAIRSYVEESGFGWQDDAVPVGGSLRLRLRAVMPELELAGLDVEAVLGSVEALRDADEVLDDALAKVMAQAEEKTGQWTLPAPALRLARREVGVRALSELMLRVTGSGQVVRRGKRVALWERICNEPAGVGELGGVRFVWDGERVAAKAG